MDSNKHFENNQIPYILLVLTLFTYLLYKGDNIVAIGLLGTLIVIFLVFNNVHIFKRKEWDRFVTDSIKKLKPSMVELVENLKQPVVGFTKDGNIVWYNKQFKALFPEEELVEIEDIISFDIEKVWKGDVPKNINIDKRDYDVNVIKYSAAQDEFEEDLIIMHLMDVTTIREVENKKVVTILAEVDNFNEVLNSAPEDKRPIITGEIERELLNYATSIKGFMKRYSNNKMIIIAPYEVIREEIKNKFPILDQIKKISHENTIEPTLSIGISYDGVNSLEDGESASKAKELALGRGGDQAVVKVGEKLSFFGGNSREMEKKSKVRSRVIAHALRDLILDSRNIYIMGHKNPDMDCLGAAIGVNAIARTLNRESKILMDDPHRNVNDLLYRMDEDENYKETFIPSSEALEKMGEKDLLVVVDVHSLAYVLNSQLLASGVRKVVIDHHRRAQDSISGAIINYIETYASSTSELLTEMIQYIPEKPKLSKEESDALLSGIWVDTKGFYYKTGVRTFEAASFLRKSGANTIDIRSMFSYDKDLYLLKASIIREAEVENGIAIAICPPGTSDPLMVAQAADEFLNLKDIHTSFVICETEDGVALSARSLGDINVQVITEKFGGGGHSTMSGAKVVGATAVEVKEKLKLILKDIQEEEEYKNESDTSERRQERR